MTKTEFEENITDYKCRCCEVSFKPLANYLAVTTKNGILLLNNFPYVFCCGDCMLIADHYRYLDRVHEDKLRRPLESDADKQKFLENKYFITKNWTGERIAILK